MFCFNHASTFIRAAISRKMLTDIKFEAQIRSFDQSARSIESRCVVIDLRSAQVYWVQFFGQPGSVSKFPPFLWVKLWVGWVGRGYTEISRYFSALWINRVTLVTKIKLWYSLGYQITFESPKCLYGMLFCVSKLDSIFSVYHSSPSSHVRYSLIGWSFILGNTDCNTVPTWWM